MVEHRYEECNDEFFLRSWKDGTESHQRGLLPTRPAWLVEIVNIAMLGSHIRIVRRPPPNAILWFLTNDAYELVSFVQFDSETDALRGYQFKLAIKD